MLQESFAQNSPAQSNHESSKGAIHPHEGNHPLQTTAQVQRHFLGGWCQNDEICTDHRQTYEVDDCMQPDEPQNPSATGVVRHLKVPQCVDHQWQAQNNAGNANDWEGYLMIAQELHHGMLTFWWTISRGWIAIHHVNYINCDSNFPLHRKSEPRGTMSWCHKTGEMARVRTQKEWESQTIPPLRHVKSLSRFVYRVVYTVR